MHTTKILYFAIIGILASFSTALYADTCPTQLTQNTKGYWTASAAPGWISSQPTAPGVTLDSNDFGGVVYSPTHNRIACVYKGSHGKWIALVSNKVSHAIQISKTDKNDKGAGLAWIYSKKHGDWACGKPFVNKITGCQFMLNSDHSQ